MNKQELINRLNKLQEEQDKEAKKEREQYPLSEYSTTQLKEELRRRKRLK